MQIVKPTKHIDVITRYFYPVAAGIETNILETYTVLQELGWDVTIHTSRDEYEKKNVLPVTDTIRGLQIKRYTWHWWGCWPAINWHTSRAVCLHNFDVFPHSLILVWSYFQKLFGRKRYDLFVIPHGGFTPEWSIFSPWVAFLKRTYHYTLGAWLLNAAADRIRAVSEWEKKEMIQHGVRADRIRVIANGLEDEAFQDIDALASKNIQQMVKGKLYTITVSRIHPIKNHETTLRAVAKSPRTIHHFFVGPVADSQYKQKLDALIIELGLQNRVRFLGVVRGIDKYYLIRHALAMVHMATWESFCNVVHEALSQGTPCIVADNTALSSLIQSGKNGFLVETFDAQALAQRISWIFEHKNQVELREMSARNQQQYRLTWRDVAQDIDTFYQAHL